MASNSSTIPVNDAGLVPVSSTSAAFAPTFVTTVPNPNLLGIYSFVLNDVIGTVASNNYLALFNPVGSGKTVFAFYAYVFAYVTGGSSMTKNSMILSRASNVVGGTLHPQSDIGVNDTDMALPVGQVYTGNPTVTAGSKLFAFPPPTVSGDDVNVLAVSPGSLDGAVTGAVSLKEGQGLVFNVAIGNTNQTWNINVVWGEM